MQVAAVDYQPRGFVLDFVIIPDQGTPTTLLAGTTYFIKTSYYSGSSVTFQPGCVIKFKQNAYMLLYGPVSFPGSGDGAVHRQRPHLPAGKSVARARYLEGIPVMEIHG